MQVDVDGQSTAVRVMGVYDVGVLRKVVPASVLSATEPTPTSGRPNQNVPTMAHWSAEGQSIP
jgi:hypothetical protein